jgi:hypothetical protein
MAQSFSFDVTTGVDLQQVDNAINQAQKEIAQRYDFIYAVWFGGTGPDAF